MISEPNQCLLDVLAAQPKHPVVTMPQKFLDEMNSTGDVQSREEFVEIVKQNLTETK